MSQSHSWHGFHSSSQCPPGFPVDRQCPFSWACLPIYLSLSHCMSTCFSHGFLRPSLSRFSFLGLSDSLFGLLTLCEPGFLDLPQLVFP